jgi:nucleoside-diphosphate-sugar epimerase
LKKILLTGATGFVGGATAATLLSSTDAELVTLVRARSVADGEARVRASVARFGVDVAASRLHVIAGDLGTHVDVRSRALSGVTHVVNAAAQTSFAARDDVRRTNVDGTVAFAAQMRALPRLERFLHVGTAWICGIDPPAVVHEDDAPSASAVHGVRYTQTKEEGEARLAALRDLPLVVARPSTVVGHTRLGCAPSASIFWTFLAMNTLRRITFELGTRVDVVPVDWVAASLVHLLAKPHLAHARYHLSAGEEASTTFEAIARAFGSAYEVDRMPILRWPVEHFAALDRRSPSRGARRFRRALALYYRFAQTNAVFDTTRLRAEGAPRSPSFASWIGACVASTRGRSLDALAADDHLRGRRRRRALSSPCRRTWRTSLRGPSRRCSCSSRPRSTRSPSSLPSSRRAALRFLRTWPCTRTRRRRPSSGRSTRCRPRSSPRPCTSGLSCLRLHSRGRPDHSHTRSRDPADRC